MTTEQKILRLCREFMTACGLRLPRDSDPGMIASLGPAIDSSKWTPEQIRDWILMQERIMRGEWPQ